MNLVKQVFLFGLVFFLLSLTSIPSYAENPNKPVGNINGPDAQQIGVKSPATDLWRAIRQREKDGSGNITGLSQVKGPNASTLINTGGQKWRNWRESKLIPYSMYAIGGTLLAIVLFRLIRGKIKIKAGRSGKKISRFTNFQRFVHWTVAILFVILGITGVILTLGRYGLLPLVGKEAFGSIAYYGKLLHNYLGPVFSVMLVVMLFTFIKGNMFNWTDIKWFLKGGGLFGGHASAGRYNGGEKLWYWAAMIVGAVVVASGLILNFPQLLPILNLSGEQFQQAQFLHAVGSIGLFVVSFGHIYMGTFAMEGAFEAMQTGECDSNWAKEHHDLWYEDLNSQGLLSAVGIGSAGAAVAGAAAMSSGGSSTASMQRSMDSSVSGTDSGSRSGISSGSADHSRSEINSGSRSQSESGANSESGNQSRSEANSGSESSSKTEISNKSSSKSQSSHSETTNADTYNSNNKQAASGSTGSSERNKNDKTSSRKSRSTGSTSTNKPDDLKKIDGIGPKIEGLLHDAGLVTYASVKKSNRDEIKAILEAAGPRYRMHEPRTWPEQAALADQGAWDELKELQDKLDGGR